MTTLRRLEPDEVMSQVVRARLESLMTAREPPDAWARDEPGAPGEDEPEVPDERGVVAARPLSRSPGAPETPHGAAGRAASEVRAMAARAVEFGRAHLVVVLVIVLAGCGYAGYSMVQARTGPVATAAPVEVASVQAAPRTPSATPRPVIRVHVVGEVRKPGVVSLPEGARVLDAIEAAGGLTARARPGRLNLAALVTDAAQVVVGGPGSPGGSVEGGAGSSGGGSVGGGGGAAASGKVNLNTATPEQLDTLPGVGPVTAKAILSWRQQHQRFSRVEELQEIEGIGPKTFEKLKGQVTVG